MESYLVAALKIFSCSMRTLSHNMWDLIPRAEIEPSTPALRAWGLSHWTTREILLSSLVLPPPVPSSLFLSPLPLLISLASHLFTPILHLSGLQAICPSLVPPPHLSAPCLCASFQNSNTCQHPICLFRVPTQILACPSLLPSIPGTWAERCGCFLNKSTNLP